jgi:hypothetical protein
MDPEDTIPPAPSQGDAETTPPPVLEVAAGEGSLASGGEEAERAHEEKEELAREVMELGLQNEYLRSPPAAAPRAAPLAPRVRRLGSRFVILYDAMRVSDYANVHRRR